ncbi:hypothetical protein WDV06_33260 [Streptomyces racemochromogenes]|uniref:Uncharacterized protein n=1 Tax=Streptomyces racemochromogenes TaxID=67353 RepID=A0ABW7PNC4_9ACTN
MPVSAVVYRRSVSGGACPACLEGLCADPAECLYFLTSRPWADCSACEGSGWAAEDADPLVFCECCGGSGLNEHTVRSVASIDVSEGAKQRHAAHVARLTARLPVSPVPVTVAA